MKKLITFFVSILAISSLACGSLDTAVTQAAATLTAQASGGGGTAPTQAATTPQPQGTGADVVLPTDTPANTEPAPTDASTAGTSRDNPAPIGTTINVGGDLTLTINSIVRPADTVVSKGNQFNTKPKAGQEYLQVTVTFVCTKASSDKCTYDGVTELKAVGTDGNILQAEFLSGVDDVLSAGELFGGAKKTGSAFYLVAKGDDAITVFYDPIFGSPTYFSLK